MAYTIDRYSGVTLTTVEDGTVDQTTDIKLVGKNYAGYGEIQNENFLHLLENFSGTSQPPKAISGQIWFDQTASKLKFYDGSRFRTTGGAEVSATQPAGLATGDLWWDSTNQQLYAYSGSGYVLIGPQGAGATVTQMKSATIRDTTNTNRLVIKAIVNDEVIFIISAVSFTIDSTDPSNAVTGFDVIKKGLTLRNTMNATGGVTSTTDYYWGTASNSLKLGGYSASDFALAGSGAFNSLVTFADAGIAIGDSSDLKIYVENDNQGVIQNEVGQMIKFKVDDAQGTVHEPVRLEATGLNPSANLQYNLGTSTLQYNSVFASSFNGTATKAATLQVGTNFRSGSTAATNNTVAVRDGSGNLVANLFTGTATQAQYADLAEKYTTDQEHPVGTIMTIPTLRDGDMGDAEMIACDLDGIPTGVISDKPAYLMNAEAEGQAVALKGKVPVRVTGPVFKGDPIYSNIDGVGSQIIQDGKMIGIALETNEDEEEKLVEVFLKV